MKLIKPFQKSEYDRRIQDVKERMQRDGFDLLICQDPANMNWLTGFDGWSFYTPQAVLLHLEEQSPIWFGRSQDAKSAYITTDISEGNIIGYSERLVQDPVQHPFDELCDLIIGRGWGNARIGIELDAHYYTARAHQHLVNGLPNALLSDNQGLVNWARLVKSETELTYMREAGRIVTDTMNTAISRLRPGTLQFEVIADVYHAQITGFNKNLAIIPGCVL